MQLAGAELANQVVFEAASASAQIPVNFLPGLSKKEGNVAAEGKKDPGIKWSKYGQNSAENMGARTGNMSHNT